MSTMTPAGGARRASSSSARRPRRCSIGSRKLRTVELDGYVDEHGVRHTMLAVFGDGSDPPLRWRVLDAVLVAGDRGQRAAGAGRALGGDLRPRARSRRDRDDPCPSTPAARRRAVHAGA